MMKKRTTHETGFAVLESLLLVVLVAIVGTVGWYVYHVNDKTTTIYNTADANSAAPVIRSHAAHKTTSSSSATTADSNLQAASTNANPNDSQSNQDTSDASSALNAY